MSQIYNDGKKYKSLCSIILGIFILVFLCAFVSCKQLFEDDRDCNGGASISLVLPAVKRSLDTESQIPAQELTQYYEVSFTRSGMTDVVIRGKPGETVNSGELLEGVYDVEVYAYSYEGKKIGYGKKGDVRVADGETTLISVGISEIKEPAFNDDDRPPIGTKARTEPKAVGDIVFSDGSATPYTAGMTITDEMKENAIALIFYKGTGLNNGSDTTTVRTLGVGLKHYKENHGNTTEIGALWCTEAASAKAVDVTTIHCEPDDEGSIGNYTFVNATDRNGSDNLEQIASFLTQNNKTDDTSTAENYPAFYFCKNYKDTASNVSGTDYESGWYLPTIAELFQIYKNGKGAGKIFDIDAAIQAVGGDTLAYVYWSSTQTPASSGQGYACFAKFNTGEVKHNSYKFNTYYAACAIREF